MYSSVEINYKNKFLLENNEHILKKVDGPYYVVSDI